MSTQEKIVNIIAGQAYLEPSEVLMTSSLEELNIDSMGVVECIFAIEEQFDVQIPFNANSPETTDFDVSSVATIVKAVDRLIADKNK